MPFGLVRMVFNAWLASKGEAREGLAMSYYLLRQRTDKLTETKRASFYGAARLVKYVILDQGPGPSMTARAPAILDSRFHAAAIAFIWAGIESNVLAIIKQRAEAASAGMKMLAAVDDSHTQARIAPSLYQKGED